MELSEVVKRVERRLAATGKKAAVASRQAGLSEDAIRNMKRALESGGRKGVSTTTISALAPVLGTSVGWLLRGEGEEEGSDRRSVPLVGYVGAGAEAHFYADADEGLGEVEGPADIVNHNTRAAEIRGVSLGPIFESWLIFYDDVRTPVSTDQHGQLCIVGLPNGQVLVKQIKPSRAEGLYHLISNSGEDTLMDQEVQWAARVIDMRPRR